MNWLIQVEKMLALGWSKLFKAMIPSSKSIYLQKILFGFGWGLVPCGLVYSVLSLSFLSGSSMPGAALMFAMGLGTLPNLLIISGGLGKLNAWMVQMGCSKHLKLITATLFFSSGGVGLYQTLTLRAQFLKNGFCFI